MASVLASANPSPSSLSPPEAPNQQLSPKKEQATNITATPIKTKEKKSRAGIPNYRDDDINALLDIAEDVEPLGANHWSIVANRFGQWADGNNRPQRDFESLRNKFDKLSNTKKKTGDPSCPPAVRRAKHISRAIHNKYAALTIDGSSGEEGETNDHKRVIDQITPDDTEKEKDVVGARAKKRKTAATGCGSSKQKTEEVLVEQVCTIAGHIGNLSNAIAGTFGLENQKEELASMIRHEVTEILRPTDILLAKMSAFLDRWGN